MPTLVEQLEVALCAAEPELWPRLLAGASTQEIEAVEERLGQAFPSDLWDLYRWRNGQRGKGTFPTGVAALRRGTWLDLESALHTRKTLLEGASPKRGWPSTAWPILASGDGDYLAVDLATGGVVFVGHEIPEPVEVAPSIEGWVVSLVKILAEEASDRPASTRGDLPPIVEPATTWSALRAWLRGARSEGSNALFVQVILASESDGSEPANGEHRAMAALRQAVGAWLTEPTDNTEAALRDALATRSRTYVPRDQVVVAVQLAGEAALAENIDRACDLALQALAAADPGLVDGTGPDVATRCRALQARLAAEME